MNSAVSIDMAGPSLPHTEATEEEATAKCGTAGGSGATLSPSGSAVGRGRKGIGEVRLKWHGA